MRSTKRSARNFPARKRPALRRPALQRPARRRLLSERLESRFLLAGPYAPAAGQPGSTAVANDNPGIVGWATEVVSYVSGTNVDPLFQDVAQALGPAEGTSSDVVTLGRGGVITLTFDQPIRDGLGFDFAVFENGFSDTFLELAMVEVSSDGSNFFSFNSASLTPAGVDAFGEVDATNVFNLAGKYRQGFGTPFDLGELAGVSPLLDITSVTHVRVVDVIGDGSQIDSDARPIYDPYPTVESAGFDLDAVAVLRADERARDVISFEDVGAGLSSQTAFSGPDPAGETITGPFDDQVVIGSFQSEMLEFNNAYSIDFESWNQWSYSNVTDSSTAGFTNQFGVITGEGANETETFGVAFADQGSFYAPPTITKEAGDERQFMSLLVTNSTYTALSMRNGDAFAKKFGGPTGNDEDFYRLTITGKNEADETVGAVEFYLADYRFADNSLDYIVEEWSEIDLTPVANADVLQFAVDSSDVGPFGMNTPAYFAIEEIVLSTPDLPLDIAATEVSESDGPNATIGRVSRPGLDTSQPLEITFDAVDANVATLPAMITIPVGESFVDFAIGTVDNDLAQGDQTIVVRASADGVVSSERTLLIIDDESPALQLTIDGGSLAEGSSLTASVSRNIADTSQQMEIQLSSSADDLFGYPATVTIPANQSSVSFEITATEDGLDRPDSTESFQAAALGFASSEAIVDWQDNDSPKLTITSNGTLLNESQASPNAGLEDLGIGLPPDSFYNGADGAGGFVSGGLEFNNDYNPDFASWSGWSYSNTSDTTTPGFLNQYSSFAGAGTEDSDTYAVAAAFGFPSLPSIKRDPDTSSGFHSIDVTNATYAALSMLQGDSFAKQFGGPSGDDADWFLLTIEGLDDQGVSVGAVEFYLADYRFSDNSMDYIVDQWTTVSLESISIAAELSFSLSSSDVGDFGMNTPAYFVADNVAVSTTASVPELTITRNTFDPTNDLEVALSSDDTSELRLASPVVIPAGMNSVTIPLQVMHDSLVDGLQTVDVAASSIGFESASETFQVADNDVSELTLTVLMDTVGESDGNLQVLVHRNSEDVEGELSVAVEADVDGDFDVPVSTTIPSGSRSLVVDLTVFDNDIADGDRQVTLSSTAEGFESGSDSVTVIDDELTLSLTIDPTQLDESDAPSAAGLEEVGATIAEDSFYNGADGAGGFQSGPLTFNNSYEPAFGSWGGWSVSNTTDQTTPGFLNQYSSFSGEGGLGSPSYAVASAFPGGGTIPTIRLDSASSASGFESVLISNTTYAALSMRDGDDFAKKFGGETGDDPDFFALTIEGFDELGDSVGAFDFYLADFRAADSSMDYIVEDWVRIDLTSLVDARELQFSLSSSDVGDFGMNTPAYFALDDLVLAGTSGSVATATVGRSGEDLEESLLVSIQNADASELRMPSQVLIPAGQSSVSFAIESVDDAVVDGAQVVAIAVSAEDYFGDTESLTVLDNDSAALTIGYVDGPIDESAGDDAGQLTIHRNTSNLGMPLSVQLAGGGDDLALPEEVVIPAGSRTVTVSIDVNDNGFRDGDRVQSIQAAAADYVSGMLDVSIIDDEQSGLLLVESDSITEVSELEGKDSIEISLLSRPQSNVVVNVDLQGADAVASPTTLTFTPDDWNLPQQVDVQGIPDLIVEGDVFQDLTFAFDPVQSDPLFADAADRVVSVRVIDENPGVLRISEDSSSVFLVDPASGVVILTNPLDEGIEVVANELAQMIDIDSLEQTSGLIRVQALGGDDTVSVHGPRFALLDGGEGYDSLALMISEDIELGDFLDQRVVAFEEYVWDSPVGANLHLSSETLPLVADTDGSLLLRLGSAQSTSFSDNAVLNGPLMIDGEFAQVIEMVDTHVQVISPTPWSNVLSPWDVNASGDVTSLDALSVINEMSRRDSAELDPIEELEDFDGYYYDVSADGFITALDALRVINELSRQELGQEGEWGGLLMTPETADQMEDGVRAAAQRSELPAAEPTSRIAAHDQVLTEVWSGDANRSQVQSSAEVISESGETEEGLSLLDSLVARW